MEKAKKSRGRKVEVVEKWGEKNLEFCERVF
jgi:hypothetical protein